MVTYERSLFIGDLHVPFEDMAAWDITLQFAKWFKPDRVFLLGDIIDFYSLSFFDRDPNRVTTLQDDLDQAKLRLDELRKACPEAKIVYLQGNHEKRLKRYLWRHPEMVNLRSLSIRSLLDLDDYDIKFVDSYLEFHGFVIEHGSLVRKNAGYTAKGQLDKVGKSGISGHSHRIGAHYHTNRSGDWVWAESGCLCKRDCVEYDPHPDWQNGFTVGWFSKHRFHIETVYIGGGKALYSGKEFTARR